jgi:hypothetical protein
MNPRNTARIVGVLFIIGTVAGISSFVGAPSLDDPDYLINISANGNLTIVGGNCTCSRSSIVVPNLEKG